MSNFQTETGVEKLMVIIVVVVVVVLVPPKRVAEVANLLSLFLHKHSMGTPQLLV